MRVLVTGANGHLGSNVVRALLAEGHEVRGLVRPTSDLRGLERLPVELVKGDVRDAQAVWDATLGVDAVIHLAAVYETVDVDDVTMRQTSDVGTRNVIVNAAVHEVKRLLYASSMVAVGFSDAPDRPRDEQQYNDRARHPYFRAKVDGERAAWAQAEELGVEMIALLPGGLLGPHDHRLTPTTRFVRDLVAGTAQTVAGGANYVDVRDVAGAFVAALSQGEPGRRYLLTGDHVELRDLGHIVYTLTGRRPAHVPLPRAALLAAVHTSAQLARWRGKAPEVDPLMAEESIGRFPVFCHEAATRDLGFYPRPVTPVLADAIRWLARTDALDASIVEGMYGRLDPSALALD